MIIVLFFVCVPPLGWLGVMIIVWVFVLRATPWLARGYDYCFLFYVPPLGWLGVMIIVFCLHATPWLARGYDYCFLFYVPPLGWLGVIIIVFLLLSSVCLIFGACVFIFLRGGVRFPNEVGVW